MKLFPHHCVLRKACCGKMMPSAYERSTCAVGRGSGSVEADYERKAEQYILEVIRRLAAQKRQSSTWWPDCNNTISEMMILSISKY